MTTNRDKVLEPMEINGAMSYGNYFPMLGEGLAPSPGNSAGRCGLPGGGRFRKRAPIR